VQVVALDAAHPENSFTYVTGADGCLYVPQLTAPSTLNVTISKDGYVSSTPTGTQATVQLDPESLSKPTFLYAPSAGIEWTGALAEYPVPSGMPVTWSINQTGSPTLVGAVGTTVTGLWPTTSGFTAWAGDCTDADPQEYAALRPSFNLVGGEARRTELDLRPVRLRKLTPGAEVTVEHVGGGAGCTTTPFAAGTANDDGVLRVGLPNGSWSFTVTDGELSETIALPEPLAPPAEGQEEQVTIVPFTVFEPEPEPTETPTEFPTESPTPSPEPSP
jgi:hypothetical protein